MLHPITYQVLNEGEKHDRAVQREAFQLRNKLGGDAHRPSTALPAIRHSPVGHYVQGCAHCPRPSLVV